MRKRFKAVMLVAGLMGVLLSCGLGLRKEPAANIRADAVEIHGELIPLPEDISVTRLLAVTDRVIVEADGAAYAVGERGETRRMDRDRSGTWTVTDMAADGDGTIWTIITDGQEGLLIQSAPDGTVLLERPLPETDCTALAVTPEDRVFLLDEKALYEYRGDAGVQRILEIPHEVGRAAALLWDQDRLMIGCEKSGGVWTYLQLDENHLIAQRFPGCVPGGTGGAESFLQKYSALEYDEVGLYGRSRTGRWETLVTWQEMHLEGHLMGALSPCDGGVAGLYRWKGADYCLKLTEEP